MIDRHLPFADSHVHFWNLLSQEIGYDWLGPAERHPSIGDIDGLKVQRFAAEEFSAITRFQHVTKAVHVGVSTNIDSVVETTWLQAMADRTGFPHGIIARCDLADPNVEAVLGRHLAHANMRGVRDNGSPGSFDDIAWRRGFERLGEHDLVFCHNIGSNRIDEAVRLLTEFPHVTLSYDHTGMPDALDHDGFLRWSDDVATLASFPNVVVKISAFGQWAGRWTHDVVKPWVETCFQQFGADRCFFGSNFPVDGLFANYSDLVDTFRTLVADRPVDEQRKILSGNVERIFRI